MKFASLKSASNRDGILCLVNRQNTLIRPVPEIAPTLQIALEQWPMVYPALQDMYHQLNKNACKSSRPYDPKELSSPLPRAYQWADGSAYVNHVELVRKARGAEMPESFWTSPLIYQGGSDSFLGPLDPIPVASETYGLDFEAEVAIITNDVPMGISVEDAKKHIMLLMLVNDISLRELIPTELAKGFGFFQSKPASSFSPLAITPDELETAWDGERLHLPLESYLNHQLIGKPNAGIDMTFSFPELIAHAAKTRNLSAGTIIGSGTVSNLNRDTGSSCLVEKRMLEIIATGKPITSYMRFGDTIRIEMHNNSQENLFGSIEQTVIPYHAPTDLP